MTEKRRGILLIAFGTANGKIIEHHLEPLFHTIALRCYPRKVYVAFTSGRIREILREREGRIIPSPEEALRQMVDRGIGDVIIQPLFITTGTEYQKLRKGLAEFAESLRGEGWELTTRWGRPLLETKQDLDQVARWMVVGKKKEVVTVYMGHGTEDPANDLYEALAEQVREQSRGTILLGTMKHDGLSRIKKELTERKETKQVHLRPLMLTGGTHALRDMAGENEDSWKSQLEALGYDVTCELRGMAEDGEIRAMFLGRIKEAEV